MWWQHEGLEQWLHDFLRDALRRRGINPLLSGHHDDPCELLSDPRSFGFSSLDMVQLASRFAACLGLDRTGLSDLLLARRSAKGWCEVARRSRQIYDEEMGFYSSGSTANPKLCLHQLSKLRAEAECFARALPDYLRVVSTVPSHHIYGFIWGILLPEEIQRSRSGIRKVPAVFIDITSSLPTSWAKQLKDYDMIVATPDTWQLLMDLNIRLPEFFVGISSTAPLPADTAAFFRAQYPHASLTEIYGSTETAGLGWRSTADTGFTLLSWWQLTQSQQNTVVVSTISDERHLLQDRIQLGADGSLHILGRMDEVIQIAGHNINLHTLAEKICRHPDVASVKVHCEQQSQGLRLHYFMALTGEPENLSHWCLDFSRWLEQTLGDVPTPSSVVVAAALPRGTNNKTVVWDPDQFEPVIGVYRSGYQESVTNGSIDKTTGLR